MLKGLAEKVVLLACFASVGGLAADSVLTPPLIPARPAAFTVDAAGKQYIAGTFTGTVDLNPGVGEVSRTSVGGTDLAIICLNADGGFVWARSFGGSAVETAVGVVLNGGFVYVAGNSSSSNGGFDGVAGTTPSGVFILALDAGTGVAKGDFDGDGIAIYASLSSAASLVSSGTNLYLGGNATVASINASSGALDTNFSTDGLQTFGGGTSISALAGIAADSSRIYLAGSFNGTGADIGSTGTGTVNAVGSDDGFVAVLDRTSGNADTTFSGDGVVTFGGANMDRFQGVSVSDGKVFLSGTLDSTNAGFGVAGMLSKAGTSPDGLVVALDSFGAPLTGFDADGVLILSPPGDGTVGLVRLSVEFGTGVVTPGVAVLSTFSASTGLPSQVVVADYDGTGAKRVTFGINGEISFNGNSTDTGVEVQRNNGRTSFAAFGNASSQPYLKTVGLIPRNLGGSANLVASFSSDTGVPHFPHFIDVFPRADDVAGGRTVTFLGNGFAAGLSVKIDTTNATSVNVSSGSKFTAVVPAGTAGDKTVSVTLANGCVLTIPNAFAYGNKAQASGSVFRGPAIGAASDIDGNTYFVGAFNGTVDFDPGAGSDMQRSAPSASTGFLTRFNANGSYGWTSLLVGLGNTSLKGVAVKGDRVFAVGDFQLANLAGEEASNAGINGLGTALCQGLGDGAMIVLDRASGAAVTAVSGDGIVTVGGSTDGVFGSTDALHSIAASPIANTLAVAGRMVATNVGFNGLGAINANDGVLFANFDTDLNVAQNVVRDYPQTPPSSSKKSGLVVYSPDGTKLTGAVLSGNQLDINQFSGNFGAVLNTFGTAGVKTFSFSSTSSNVALDSTNDIIAFAWTNSGGSGSTVQTLDNASGTIGQICGFTPKAGQTPPRFVDNCSVAFNRLNGDCVADVVCTGDLTFTSGSFTQDIPAQNADQFDGNIVIFVGNISNPQAFANSAQVCKGDGGGAEDCNVLVATATGVKVVGESSPPSTVVRMGSEEATPGEFKGFVVTATGGGTPPPGVPPTITNGDLSIVQGEESTVILTAEGTLDISFEVLGVTIISLAETNFPLEKIIAPNTSATIVGKSLFVKTLRSTVFFIRLKAKNQFGDDVKDLRVDVTVNPKAPQLTILATPIFVSPGEFQLSYIVTGQQPIDVNSNLGTVSDSKIKYTIISMGDGVLFDVTFEVVAVNEFGIDRRFVKVNVVGKDHPKVDLDKDGVPNDLDNDDDGDGIPDTTELGAESDPFDSSDSPGGGAAVGPVEVTTKSVSLKISLGNPDAPDDSILDSIGDFVFTTGGGLSRAAPKLQPGPLVYDFGGVVRVFNIDEKGKGVLGNDKASVKIKQKKGQDPTVSISVSIKKANLKTSLADEGFISKDTKKEALSVQSFVAYGGTGIQRTITLEYSAKAGKAGSAKLKK